MDGIGAMEISITISIDIFCCCACCYMCSCVGVWACVHNMVSIISVMCSVYVSVCMWVVCVCVAVQIYVIIFLLLINLMFKISHKANPHHLLHLNSDLSINAATLSQRESWEIVVHSVIKQFRSHNSDCLWNHFCREQLIWNQ